MIISDFEGMNENDFYKAITGFNTSEPVLGKSSRNIWAVHEIDPRFKTSVWQEDALVFAKEFEGYIQQAKPELYNDYYQPCLENLKDAYNNEDSQEVSKALECLVASIKFKQ